MLLAVGSRVQTLHRVQVGPIELGDHPEGLCRRLGEAEVQTLRAAVAERRAAHAATLGKRRAP
jgi:16S rRNA U516 pseudouridylate synthase RsuA-like enzyme